MATQSVYRTVMKTSGETNPEAATRGTAAVLQTLRDRPSPDEADQVVAEVPWGLMEIWEAPRRASGAAGSVFLKKDGVLDPPVR